MNRTPSSSCLFAFLFTVLPLALIAAVTGSDSFGADQSMAFPASAWEEVAPEAEHVDSTRLKEAVDYLAQHAGRDGVKELVIVRNGRVIWKGIDAGRAHNTWSMGKVLTSTVLGLLVDDGVCAPETLAKDIIPALADQYPHVTLRHFATMTSGFRAQGDDVDPRGYTHGPSKSLVPHPTPLFTPGERFAYWDSAMNQFGFCLTRLAGQSLEDMIKRRITTPMGMDPNRWSWRDLATVEGVTIDEGCGHVAMCAADWARIGHLFLNRGNWNGNQLLSAAWVDLATSVQVPAQMEWGDRQRSGFDLRGWYGFQWYTNGRGADGERKWPHAPSSTFNRSGYNNNEMFVIPPWRMVIVRLGMDERDRKITDAVYDSFLHRVGDALIDPNVEGELRVWHPLAAVFRGPEVNQTDNDPNPFLDYRLQVCFQAPSGRTWNVPGFFDGDGHGGPAGRIWRARFTPDEAGVWQYVASLRKGPAVAVSLDAEAGEPISFDGQSGSFSVQPPDPQAPGFLKWGRLEYVGAHYLKFANGPYWIRGGTDSPENLLAYAGFSNTRPSHHFEAHASDWRSGDPDWNAGKGRGIIGALNDLAARHVNSIYFLVMNVGGDGNDVWPWSGPLDPKGSPDNDNVHFDIGKLRQWDTVFEHAQRQGIFLHFVLNEAEESNKRELDGGELGPERKLYYRELVARFAHHLALQWNLCEEYNLRFDFGPKRIRQFADYLRSLDAYGHPVTVHPQGDPRETLAFMFGDERFSMTSIQLNQRRIDELVEHFRRASASGGRKLPVSMDEFTVDKGQDESWRPRDDAELHRKQKIWPTYLSGGNIEFILEDLLETESFKTTARAELWNYVWNARKFIEEHLPFWEMEPADHLVDGAATIPVGLGRKRTFALGAQVFAKEGQVYAIYLPSASVTGTLNLTGHTGSYTCRWYNPRSGCFEGDAVMLDGDKRVPLGQPPNAPQEDWVVLIRSQRP